MSWVLFFDKKKLVFAFIDSTFFTHPCGRNHYFDTKVVKNPSRKNSPQGSNKTYVNVCRSYSQLQSLPFHRHCSMAFAICFTLCLWSEVFMISFDFKLDFFYVSRRRRKWWMFVPWKCVFKVTVCVHYSKWNALGKHFRVLKKGDDLSEMKWRAEIQVEKNV